jgi:amino acid permease
MIAMMNEQKQKKRASSNGRKDNKKSGNNETRKNKTDINHKGMDIRRRIKKRKAGMMRIYGKKMIPAELYIE